MFFRVLDLPPVMIRCTTVPWSITHIQRRPRPRRPLAMVIRRARVFLSLTVRGEPTRLVRSDE